MKTVFKYDLEWADRQVVYLPENSQIIDAEIQDEQLRIWALHDVLPQEINEVHYIRIAGTGHDIRDNIMRHLKTLHNRGFVWHIFETTRPREDPGD